MRGDVSHSVNLTPCGIFCTFYRYRTSRGRSGKFLSSCIKPVKYTLFYECLYRYIATNANFSKKFIGAGIRAELHFDLIRLIH